MNKFKKAINISLIILFILTVAAPITGLMIYKLASSLFLVLALVHTCLYRRAGAKNYLPLCVVLGAFVSGVLAVIFSQYTIAAALHKLISIAAVFVLAIHIFIHRKKIAKSEGKNHA